MKKITLLLVVFFIAVITVFAAEKVVWDCEKTETYGKASVAGNGKEISATTEVCTNSDKTVRNITTTQNTTTKVGVEVAGNGGGSKTTTSTKIEKKQYFCSTCQGWFDEKHTHKTAEGTN
jgi:hypothetical protein|nr:hypothetical protein [uncultured Treponema sp.]